MTLGTDEACLVGLGATDLVPYGATRLLPEVLSAFEALREAAAAAGFDLRVASGYRDFARQLRIWNAKLSGARPVFDDTDRVLDLLSLSTDEQLRCVMRFSALPGASRHHWGTDLDVYDGSAVAEDYVVQLSAAEVAPHGLFGALHEWLDERIAMGQSFGFYRPYGRDRGAVAPERWHLSYAPLAREFQQRLTPQLLVRAWDEAAPTDTLACRPRLESQLGELLARYVYDVDEPPAAALLYKP